jgi:hypothetical protein
MHSVNVLQRCFWIATLLQFAMQRLKMVLLVQTSELRKRRRKRSRADTQHFNQINPGTLLSGPLSVVIQSDQRLPFLQRHLPLRLLFQPFRMLPPPQRDQPPVDGRLNPPLQRFERLERHARRH